MYLKSVNYHHGYNKDTHTGRSAAVSGQGVEVVILCSKNSREKSLLEKVKVLNKKKVEPQIRSKLKTQTTRINRMDEI